MPERADPALLSPQEADQAARFRHPDDRRAYITAHALKREMISRATGLPAAALHWELGAHGRPELHRSLGQPALRFNLTHCRTLVACVISCVDDVGVDVETESRGVDALGLARQSFAPEEAAYLAALPPELRAPAFLRLWTLKEAFVKALGDGLSFGLERFAVRLDPIRLAHAPASAGPRSAWRFLQIEPIPGHILSVAFRPRPVD